MSEPERIRLTYHLTCAHREDAAQRAREIALEQTVELPEGAFPLELEEQVVGRLESIAPVDEGRWKVVISHQPGGAGEDLPQLLNLLFGNISLQTGIRLVDVALPESVLARLPGPRFGIPGLRKLTARHDGRPLLCVAIKPVGFSAGQLAELCGRFAAAGIDVVKDDHGLTNQGSAPFAERLRRCQEAVNEANARSGGSTIYAPNLTSPVDVLGERLELARRHGCRAVLLSPFLIGLDAVRWVAECFELAVLSHPALTGVYFYPFHGIAPDVLLGTLFRVAGSDGVIYPNAGGRFPFTRRTCEVINSRLRSDLGRMRPSMPMPGGGVEIELIPEWVEAYGADTMFLVGASLYRQRDPAAAARRLVETVRRLSPAAAPG
jgi:ribulose-bisphosphate carboxylase large chain